MIVYISGPITGHDGYLKNFRRAEGELREAGHIPVNPACIFEPFAKTNADHDVFLESCLRLMGHCGAIYMLDGWEDSKGAVLELAHAREIGLDVMWERRHGRA